MSQLLSCYMEALTSIAPTQKEQSSACSCPLKRTGSFAKYPQSFEESVNKQAKSQKVSIVIAQESCDK